MRTDLKYALWVGGYLLRRHLLARRRPFIGGLVLNDSCNLHCQQCRLNRADAVDLAWPQVLDGLRTFRRMGLRNLAVTGGEPFHWRDGDRTLADVLATARDMGFLATALYTNGTYPIETNADTVFIGLDGRRAVHESLRGCSYEQVMSNMAASAHPNLMVNCSINQRNCDDLEPFCDELAGRSYVKGVFFYFHTPYYGRDALYLPADRRREIAARLLTLRRRYPLIMNSTAGLRAYIADRWQRPGDICHTYAYGKVFPCCRSVASPEVCRDCGYLGYLEVQQMVAMRPSAMWAARRYLPRRCEGGEQ